MDAVNLYQINFWWFVAIALLVLVPQVRASPRKWAFAGLNIGFLTLQTQPGEYRAMVVVLLGVLAAWLVLRWAGRAGRGASWAVWLGGAAVLGLFLLHKLPHAAAGVGAERAEPILAAIGFSYVALRLIDATRAIRDDRLPSPDLPMTLNYLLPFHMLAAGPIQTYEEFISQPAVPPALTPRPGLGRAGAYHFGSVQKVYSRQLHRSTLPDRLPRRGPYFLLELQLNFLWLYLDFSAYSDVAIGLGSLLGIATPENFNRPLFARNLIEFWERWHITLSRFIRNTYSYQFSSP